MFDKIHIRSDVLTFVNNLAVKIGYDPATQDGRHISLRSRERGVVFSPRSALMTAVGIQRRAVGILENRRHRVVDISVSRLRDANHASAKSIARCRRNVVHRPQALIEGVDMLFHVKIAGKPRVIIPIPNLRNKFRVSFNARARPVISSHIRESSRRNIADRSVKDALHNVSDVQVISPA